MPDEGVLIRIENITVCYGDKIAVEDVSFTFEAGFIYGIIGPNGAGKSSLINTMVGILPVHAGSVQYDQDDLSKNSRNIKYNLGYAPENIYLYEYLTGREYLQMISEIKRLPETQAKIAYLLNQLNLKESADQIIVSYSHGMRKKTALAASLLGPPRYIILDEALNGLDPVAMYNVRHLLRNYAKQGSTILLSSHILELMENWCDYIIVMKDARLLAAYSQEDIERLCAETGTDFSTHFIRLVAGDDQSST